MAASTRAKALLAALLAAEGRNKEAAGYLEKLESRESIDHHAAYSMSGAYAQLGDDDKSLYWLKRTAATGLACVPLFERDKLLDPIRTHPEFAALLNELRERAESIRQKYAN